MVELPPSEVYEQELIYMPYKKSLGKVLDIFVRDAPYEGNVLDLMCGPGYLLGQIRNRRDDLDLNGIDLDERYIEHARERYPGVRFECEDVMNFLTVDELSSRVEEGGRFDAVLCTGALHHLNYKNQELFIQLMPSLIKKDGFCIVSDCYVDDYSNETERKLVAARLGYEYLAETIRNGADNDVVKATAEIISNDVMMDEFKTSLEKRLVLFAGAFSKVQTLKTWPNEQVDGRYGDYIHLLRN
jgi:SAM-dependent methyltransferase